MLSKLLQSARNIVPFKIPAYQTGSETAATSLTSAMVTKRGQSGNKPAPATEASLARGDISTEVTTTSSRKRRRVPAPEDSKTRDESTPTPPTKRRKDLPLRSKDEEQLERQTCFAVEILVNENMEDIMFNSTRSSQQRPRGKKVLAKDTSVQRSEVLVGHRSSGDEEPSKDGISLSPSGHGAVEEENAVPILLGPESKEPGQSKKIIASPKRKGNPIPEPTLATIASNPAKPKHERFGSEEPAVESKDVVTEEAKIAEESNETSDDDAPEVIATQDAQEKARAAVRNASKAAKYQDSIIRKKRKDRDAQLKEQARNANKKRKHVHDTDEDISTLRPAGVFLATALMTPGEGKEEVRVMSAGQEDVTRDEAEEGRTLLTSNTLIEGNKPPEDPNLNLPKSSQSTTLKPGSKRTISRSNLPEFLPAEYLEDEPTTFFSPLQTAGHASLHKSKRTKFTDSTTKKPRDRTRGSTTYRVSEARGDGMLAPKVINNARSIKEAWLKGRGGGANRKPVNGGFFKNMR